MQIHDELLFEVEEAALPRAAEVIRECMEHAAALQVPMPVKLHVGHSWGSLQRYHPVSMPQQM